MSVFSRTPSYLGPLVPPGGIKLDRVDGTARERLLARRENPSLRAATLLDRVRRFCHFRALVLHSGSGSESGRCLVKRNNSGRKEMEGTSVIIVSYRKMVTVSMVK